MKKTITIGNGDVREDVKIKKGEKMERIPEKAWAKMPEGTLKYQAADYLKTHTVAEAIKRFRDTATGTQIPGRSAEAEQVAQALESIEN